MPGLKNEHGHSGTCLKTVNQSWGHVETRCRGLKHVGSSEAGVGGVGGCGGSKTWYCAQEHIGAARDGCQWFKMRKDAG